MRDVNGVLVRETRADIPARCACCDRPRKLLVFRNGPKTQLAVCPNTRHSFVLFDTFAAVMTGFYTGSLNGV